MLAATFAGFATGVDPAWPAVAGAAAMVAVERVKPREVLRAVDVPLLVFVLGLAIIVRAVGAHGVGDHVADLLPTGDNLLALIGATLVAAVLANLLNNVPAVLLLLPAAAAGGTATVLAVLIGVNAGPNLTPTGSLATLLWRRVLRARDSEPSLGRVPQARGGDGASGARPRYGRAVAGPAGDRMKRVLVWVTPTGWEACIDAAREYDDVTLLQVSDVGPPGPGGLLGRHRPPPTTRRSPSTTSCSTRRRSASVATPTGCRRRASPSMRCATPPRTSTS